MWTPNPYIVGAVPTQRWGNSTTAARLRNISQRHIMAGAIHVGRTLVHPSLVHAQGWLGCSKWYPRGPIFGFNSHLDMRRR